MTEYRRSPNGVWQLLDEESGSWVNERSIPASERPWRPFLQEQPYRPDGTPGELAEGETFWANSHYLVIKRLFKVGDEFHGAHLSMRTVENDVRHDWREMQRVKNELLGEDWEAVELYPAERRVVDMANQFHLFGFPHEIPIGFPVTDPEAVRKTASEAAAVGAVQRPRDAGDG